jgi:hypothetical protein
VYIYILYVYYAPRCILYIECTQSNRCAWSSRSETTNAQGASGPSQPAAPGPTRPASSLLSRTLPHLLHRRLLCLQSIALPRFSPRSILPSPHGSEAKSPPLVPLETIALPQFRVCCAFLSAPLLCAPRFLSTSIPCAPRRSQVAHRSDLLRARSTVASLRAPMVLIWSLAEQAVRERHHVLAPRFYPSSRGMSSSNISTIPCSRAVTSPYTVLFGSTFSCDFFDLGF